MTQTEPCAYCAQDMHFLCRNDTDCCCEDMATPIEQVGEGLNLKEDKEPAAMGRPLKTEGFKNLISTGRKRAAKLYAIQPGQVCEWAYKANCGGGIEPITGCSGRPAEHIHHGPDKSVLNNRPDNVSVICTHCHNKWHGVNDKYYPNLHALDDEAYDRTGRPLDGSAWLPKSGDSKVFALSDMIDATEEEIAKFEEEQGR